MNHKLIKIFLTVFLCMGMASAFAQRPFRWPTSLYRKAADVGLVRMGNATIPLNPSLTSPTLSATLHQQVLETYKQARSIQTAPHTPFLWNIYPSKKIVGISSSVFSVSPVLLYPEAPFLHSSHQLTDYFLTRNNTLALQERARMTSWLGMLSLQNAVLKQETQALPQPQNQVSWLVDQIPQEITNLFIGEMHHYNEIQQLVGELFYFVRQKQPSREIFLFTEFLPSQFQWTQYNDPDTHPYGPVWQAAKAQNISIIGLEPSYVNDNMLMLEYKTPNGEERMASVWSSPEGMRLRNEHYRSVLEQYRKLYPNALFIIYTGASHCGYTSLSSISRGWPEKETFVVSIYPQQRLAITPAQGPDTPQIVSTSIMSEFDQATGGEFKQHTLYWKTKSSARLAGFDVQLKIPAEQ